jgi:hypothetical protein
VREYVQTDVDKAVEMKGTVACLPVAVAMETHSVLRSSEQWQCEFNTNTVHYDDVPDIHYIEAQVPETRWYLQQQETLSLLKAFPRR